MQTTIAVFSLHNLVQFGICVDRKQVKFTAKNQIKLDSLEIIMLNPLEKHCPHPLEYLVAAPSKQATKQFHETSQEFMARVYSISLTSYSETKARDNVIAIMFALLKSGQKFPAIIDLCAVIGQDNILQCLLVGKFGTNPVVNFKIARKLCYLDLSLDKVPVLARYILNLHQEQIKLENFSANRVFRFLGEPAKDDKDERGILVYSATNVFRWVLYDEYIRGVAFKSQKAQLALITHPSLKEIYIQDNKLFLEQEEFLFQHDHNTMMSLEGFLYHSRKQARRWKSLLE